MLFSMISSFCVKIIKIKGKTFGNTNNIVIFASCKNDGAFSPDKLKLKRYGNLQIKQKTKGEKD